MVDAPTDVLHDTIVDWLAEWSALSAPVELCRVTVVSAAPGGPDVVGTYERIGRTVRVLDGPEEDVRATLLHEYCHAVDLQNGPIHRRLPVWRLDPQDPNAAGGRDRVAAEAFAEWCAVGPEALALSSRSDAHRMLDVAWPGVDAEVVRATRSSLGDPLRAPTGRAFRSAGVLEGGTLQLGVFGADPFHGEVMFVDPIGCVETEPSLTVRPEGEAPAPPAGLGWSSAAATGGGFVAVGYSTLPDGGKDHPLAWWDGSGWRRIEDGSPSAPVRAVGVREGTTWVVDAVESVAFCSALHWD